MRKRATVNGDVFYTEQEEIEADIREAEAEVERDERVALAESNAQKLAGVLIEGVMCSATGKDQAGLLAVATEITFKRGVGQVAADTKFYFENGNTLVITDGNFDQAYSTWAPFRQSFFSP
jgi:hypothetical protein